MNENIIAAASLILAAIVVAYFWMRGIDKHKNEEPPATMDWEEGK